MLSAGGIPSVSVKLSRLAIRSRHRGHTAFFPRGAVGSIPIARSRMEQ
jgi:hypothetical protein